MGRRSKSAANPLLAIAYIRVSTDDQALGPDAQRVAIARWAASNCATVIAECVDLGVSGAAELAGRPGLMSAIAALDAHGAGLLVVAKRDRLARDVVVAAAVERLAESKGARVASADGTGNADGPEGMLLRGLVDLFAQYERALIRSRTRAALAVKKQRGERVGAVPFGCRVVQGEPGLRADAVEHAALRRLQELSASGHSVRAIAATLNCEGVPARGKRWHATTVARLLQRSVAALE